MSNSQYLTSWIGRLIGITTGNVFMVTAFHYSLKNAMLSCVVAVIFLLVIDLFQYAYRTYGDRKQ